MARETINKIGFFMIGFALALGYNIIFSASFDLMTTFFSSPINTSEQVSNNNTAAFNQIQPQFCNSGSTSIILITLTFPAIVLKIIFAFYMIDLNQNTNVMLFISLQTLAYVILGTANCKSFAVFGMVLVSLGLAISDATTVSICPQYGVRCLGCYYFGSAIGSFITSFMYALMRMYMSLSSVMFSALIMPLVIGISYIVIIRKLNDNNQIDQERNSIIRNDYKQEKYTRRDDIFEYSSVTEAMSITDLTNKQDDDIQCQYSSLNVSFDEKIQVCSKAVYYFLPLFTSFSVIYYANQGLYELIDIEGNSFMLDNAAQYRWYQFTYQFGCLLGTPLGDCIYRTKNLWHDPIILLVTLSVMLLQVFSVISISFISIVFMLTFLQGLIATHNYICVMYKVSEDFAERVAPFAMVTVSFADITSSVIPAFLALLTHSTVCNLHVKN